MFREVPLHVDWCEKTMSMMREKQSEACERLLFAHPSTALFASDASECDAQALLTCSYDNFHGESRTRLVTLSELRERVLKRMPVEAVYLDIGERQLLDRLLMENGCLRLQEWDDISAAEALVSRLWCGFRAEDDDWFLTLPKALHQPLLNALHRKNADKARERLDRYDALIHGLLYLAGLLHSSQPIEFFTHDVMRSKGKYAAEVARRYLQATMDYITDARGDMILLHPGLADPYQLVRQQAGVLSMDISQEMLAGGINGILEEEVPLHHTMCGALYGALRPECDVDEAAEDLRMLAKQNVGLKEMEGVLSSMLAVLPTPQMLSALKNLRDGTPRWLSLQMAAVQ